MLWWLFCHRSLLCVLWILIDNLFHLLSILVLLAEFYKGLICKHNCWKNGPCMSVP